MLVGSLFQGDARETFGNARVANPRLRPRNHAVKDVGFVRFLRLTARITLPEGGDVDATSTGNIGGTSARGQMRAKAKGIRNYFGDTHAQIGCKTPAAQLHARR